MEICTSDIPKTNDLVRYVEFFQKIYKQLFDDKTLRIVNLNKLEEHFAMVFDDIRMRMDEDLFQYNHAMIVFIVLCVAYSREEVQELDEQYFKDYLILPPSQKSLSGDMLNLHILHCNWSSFKIETVDCLEAYIRAMHKSLAQKMTFADSLAVMNRWNLVKKVSKNLFLPNEEAMMLSACRVNENIRQLLIMKTISKHLVDDCVYTFTDDRLLHFFNFCCKEKTYFQIRQFRTRILNVFYLFLFDKPQRDFYTYSRAGEIPSTTAIVTSKFPSQFSSSIQHAALYGQPEELFGHNNKQIQDATLLSFFEAYMKTIFSFQFTKFCICLNFTIFKQIKHVLLAEHPVILLACNNWYLANKGKIYMYANLQETILAWLFHIRDDYNCLVQKQISLLKICNVLCKDLDEEREENSDIVQNYIEIDI